MGTRAIGNRDGRPTMRRRRGAGPRLASAATAETEPRSATPEAGKRLAATGQAARASGSGCVVYEGLSITY